MARYAGVLPDPGRALNQLFTYRIPEHLAAAVQPGAEVLVPFGPRSLVGLVLAVSDETDRTDLKDLEAVLEGAPPSPRTPSPSPSRSPPTTSANWARPFARFCPRGWPIASRAACK